MPSLLTMPPPMSSGGEVAEHGVRDVDAKRVDGVHGRLRAVMR
jgi:hypothetical protein